MGLVIEVPVAGVTLTSPLGTIVVGGTPTAPTLDQVGPGNPYLSQIANAGNPAGLASPNGLKSSDPGLRWLGINQPPFPLFSIAEPYGAEGILVEIEITFFDQDAQTTFSEKTINAFLCFGEGTPPNAGDLIPAPNTALLTQSEMIVVGTGITPRPGILTLVCKGYLLLNGFASYPFGSTYWIDIAAQVVNQTPGTVEVNGVNWQNATVHFAEIDANMPLGSGGLCSPTN